MFDQISIRRVIGAFGVVLAGSVWAQGEGAPSLPQAQAECNSIAQQQTGSNPNAAPTTATSQPQAGGRARGAAAGAMAGAAKGRSKANQYDIAEGTKSKSIYDGSAERKFFEKTQHRKPLSPSDEKAVVATLNKFLPEDAAGGTIHQSPNIRIDYISTFNTFYVEIATPNTEKAKEESIQWFRSQGLSQEFICNFPIDFSLSPNLAYQFRSSNKIFSSSLPGCQ